MQDLRSNVPWSISFRHGSPIPKLFAYSIDRNPTSSWSAAGRKRGTVHRDEKMVRNVNIATKMKMYSPVRKNLIKFCVKKYESQSIPLLCILCDDLLVVRIFIEIWCGSICKCLQGIQISVPKWIENGFLQPWNNREQRKIGRGGCYSSVTFRIPNTSAIIQCASLLEVYVLYLNRNAVVASTLYSTNLKRMTKKW